MAGTVTLIENVIGSVKKIEWDWLSDAAGDADQESVEVYNGELLFAAYTPDGGGTQPTNLYDVVVNDADGVDILGGDGIDKSNAAAVFQPDPASLGVTAHSKLTLVPGQW
jgi:hypothetical protein